MKRLLIAALAVVAAVALWPDERPRAAFGSLPLAFEPNRGQAPERFDFVARSASGAAGISAREATIGGVTLRFVDAAASRPQALDRLPGRVNHLVGDDPSRWRTGIPTYERVRYRELWPGIDVIWHGDQRRLEYDFALAPGADPRCIAFTVTGGRPRVTARGDLEIGGVRQLAPHAYQGGRTVAAAYEVDGRTVRLRLGAYDRSRPLVIDPVVLAFSTYLGGSGFDIPYDVAVDSSGVYVAGRTSSTDFDRVGGIEGDEGGVDAFVAKLNPAGNALAYSTYLGGSGLDEATAIALDAQGFAYITGTTASTDFNTVDPIHGDRPGLDAFVAKLNPAGNTLAYSTYLGGSDDDRGSFGIAVDSTLAAYVIGVTDSDNFPLDGEIMGDQPGTDVVVSKLTATGDALAYSTYLGGSGDDLADGLGIDPLGSAYVVGSTGSTDFPRVNEIEGDSGSDDMFVAKLNPPGDALAYSTYLGGSDFDFGHSIAVHPTGRAYIAGHTFSTDFNTTPGAIEGDSPSSDAIVAALHPDGRLAFSTYLGGSSADRANGIALDGIGFAYVSGETNSLDFDTVLEHERDSDRNGADAFVARINPDGTVLSHSTYLGGSGDDHGHTIAVDTSGAYVTGFTDSRDFDLRGPYEGDSGFDDGFVTKLAFTGSGPIPTATPPPPLPTPTPLPPPEPRATDGPDRLTGTNGADTICGLGGPDTIAGFRGNDALFGDACEPGAAVTGAARSGAARFGAITGAARFAAVADGDDRLDGGPGDDRLHGSGGDDRLLGRAGADALDGGAGRDVVVPGPGRDTIVAGRGSDLIRARDRSRDTIRCGKGADRVVADERDRLRGCERVTLP